MKTKKIFTTFLLSVSIAGAGEELEIISNYSLPYNTIVDVYKETKDKDLILKLLKRTGDIESAYFEGNKLIINRKLYIRKIKITGNWSFWRSEILAAIGLNEGMAVDDGNLRIVKERLKRFYIDKGYPYVKIDFKYKKTRDGYVDIWIHVNRGKQYQISTIKLNYTDRKPTKNLEKKLIESMELQGKTFSIITIQEGIDKGENFLQSVGFYDAYINLEGYTPKGSTKFPINLILKNPMELKMSVYLGSKYIIQIKGVSGRIKKEILKQLTLKTEGISRHTIEENAKIIKNYLKNLGYLDVKVKYSSKINEKKDRYIVLYNVELGKLYKITSIEIFTDDNSIKERFLKLKNKPAEIGKVKELLETLVEEAREEGYWGARGKINLTKLSEEDIRLQVYFFKDKKHIIKDIVIKGCKNFLEDNEIDKPKYYNPEWSIQLKERIKDYLITKKGYLDADVSLEIKTEEKNNKIYYTLIYKVKKGSPYTRKAVFIYGTKHIIPEAIEKSLFRKVKSGFTFEKLENNMNYLYKSFLFTEVRGFAEKIKDKKEVIESYVLKEDKRGLFQASIGINSEEDFRLSSLLVLKNLFKRGYEATGYINISQRNILSRVSFGSRVLPYKTSFFTNFYKDKQYHKKYNADIEGYGIEFSKFANKWVIHKIKMERDYVKLGDLPENYIPEKKNYFVLKLGYHILDDHRDNKIDPRWGYFFEGIAYRYIGDYNLYKVSSQFRYYVSRSVITFTQRYSGGYVLKNIDEIPISERYFLGGVGNFRGFSFEQLGGIHGLGGKSFLLINTDIRFPIYKIVKGFVFVDIGNVFEKDSELRDFETRETGGIGIYIPTPAGVFIIDYAKKLDKKKGETPNRFEFQISILF